MGSKITADEISSIIEERINNFEVKIDNDTGFNTDTKWRDLLEISKSLETSNHNLKNYLKRVKGFIDSVNKEKLLSELNGTISKNDGVYDTIITLYKNKSVINNGVVTEEDSTLYLRSMIDLENCTTLSETIEHTTKNLIEQYSKEN